jgi:hypothetical protein
MLARARRGSLSSDRRTAPEAHRREILGATRIKADIAKIHFDVRYSESRSALQPEGLRPAEKIIQGGSSQGLNKKDHPDAEHSL